MVFNSSGSRILARPKNLDSWGVKGSHILLSGSNSRGLQQDAKCQLSWLVQNSRRTPNIDSGLSQESCRDRGLLIRSCSPRKFFFGYPTPAHLPPPPLLQKSGPLYLKYSSWILKNSSFSAAQIPSQLLKCYQKV